MTRKWKAAHVVAPIAPPTHFRRFFVYMSKDVFLGFYLLENYWEPPNSIYIYIYIFF